MAQRLKKVDGQPNLSLDLDSGIYYVRVQINRRSLWRSTRCTTERSAISEARQILGALEAGRGKREKRIPTLTEWWKDYRSAKQKSPRTWKREEEIMDQHVLPQFGRLGLDEITKNQMERYLQWRRRQKVAEGTVTREHSLLHAVFEAAIDEGLIQLNPLRGIPRQAYKSRDRVLTEEEQEKLLPHLTPLVARYFRFLLGTGLRAGDVTGIRPAEHIDWAGKRFLVTGKGHNGVPKVRWVPFIPSVEKTLIALVKEQVEENEGDAKHHRSKRSGTLWAQSPDSLAKELRKACDKADVKRFGPHVLRHTFATRYLAGGGDIYILSQILGHSDVGITQRVYAHLLTTDLAARSAHVKISV